MFTGIVEEIGIVKGTTPSSLTIKAKQVLSDMKLGDSIAINGACLTVASINGDNFSVDIMPETVRRTNLGKLHYGDRINLERAISYSGRFGGHFVQGHIDGLGEIVSLKHQGKAVIAMISANPEIMAYIVDKGFVAIDGVSLTITNYDHSSFSLSLVTYTRQHTTLGTKRPGDSVNIEVDIIAKYVERFSRGGRQGLTLNFLEEHDFLKAR